MRIFFLRATFPTTPLTIVFMFFFFFSPSHSEYTTRSVQFITTVWTVQKRVFDISETAVLQDGPVVLP